MAELKLKDEVAIVTGGANGIGKAISELFAQEGADVVIADINYKKAVKVSQNIIARGGKSRGWKIDVGSKSDVDKMANNVVKRYGKIDILVNNAMKQDFFPFLEFPLSNFNAVLRTNLIGPFYCTQRVAKEMIKNQPYQNVRGCIINLSSPHAYLPMENGVAYSVSKFGIEGLTRNSGQELAKYQIKVNSIVPGATWSASTTQMFTPPVQKSLKAHITLSRIVNP